MSISPFLRDIWDFNPTEFFLIDYDLPGSNTSRTGAPRRLQERQTDVHRFRPPVDILDEENSLVYMVELPGLQKTDVNLGWSKNGLMICGKKQMPQETGTWLRREIVEGEFSRTIPVPKGIDPKSICAKFENGILRITVPKMEEREEKGFEIPITFETTEEKSPEMQEMSPGMTSEEKTGINIQNKVSGGGPEISEKSEMSEKPKMSEMSEKSEKSEQFKKPEKSKQFKKPEKSEQFKKPEKSEMSEKPRSTTVQKPEKPEKPKKSGKFEKGGVSEKSGKSEKGGKSGDFMEQGRSEEGKVVE